MLPTIYLLRLYMQSFVHMVTHVVHVVLLFMGAGEIPNGMQIIQYIDFMCPTLDQKKLVEYYENYKELI